MENIYINKLQASLLSLKSNGYCTCSSLFALFDLSTSPDFKFCKNVLKPSLALKKLSKMMIIITDRLMELILF